MSYQALARKYRPQTFDEVVGQRGTTETLRNAITNGRLTQSFIFSGARGVGKTTTARILAKALNCVNGPTASPCGSCDACVEIAEGRDIDVIEIDAATHTGVDNVREVIIESLAVRPVRDHRKVFIIDEVHMLSTSSFNALLKSIEEPPPHVVFIMATTELHKIPDTIRSRSQEYEFRTIGLRDIVAQLQKISVLEHIEVEPAALQMLARAAEGSLRDAESAFDQVIAFAGTTVTADDVASVLGLVGRDLLLDIVEVVADEDAPRVFDIVGRAVESGHDLRLLCRELSRVVRDMMVIRIDPDRINDPEYLPEGDIDRLTELAGRHSREDLLRAFDVMSRAEFDLRNASQPRYTLEMTLLKWMHLRSVAPIARVLEALGSGPPPPSGAGSTPRRPPRSPGRAPSSQEPGSGSAQRSGPTPVLRHPASERPTSTPDPAHTPAATPSSRPTLVPPADDQAPGAGIVAGTASPQSADDTGTSSRVPISTTPASGTLLRDGILNEIKKVNKVFHGAVATQAARVELADDTLTFTFAPNQRVLRAQFEQKRALVEQVAERVAARPVKVASVESAPPPEAKPPSLADHTEQRLRQAALAEEAVQALLDVFPAEITSVVEIKE